MTETDERPTLFPLERRLQGREGWAWVARDNFDQVADRLVAIVGTDRTFTLFHRYLHDHTEDCTRIPEQDMWNMAYEAKMGLHLEDNSAQGGYPAVRRWETSFREQKGISWQAAPGIVSFGISVCQDHAIFEPDSLEVTRYVTDTEQGVYEYTSRIEREEPGVFKRFTDVTFVRWDGFANEHDRQDRILIQDWNQHGVCSETLVLFDGRYWQQDVQHRDFVEEMGGFEEWSRVWNWALAALGIEERDYDKRREHRADIDALVRAAKIRPEIVGS